MWTRFLYQVFPPGSSGEDTRHRFAAIALALGLLLSLITAPLFALANPELGLVVSAYGGGTVVLALLLRWTRRAGLAFWTLQVLSAALFLACRWTEASFDSGWAMWLAVLPLTAMLYGGARAGVRSFALAIAAGSLMVLVPDPGLFTLRPVSTVPLLVRVLSFFVAVFVLAASWQKLREDALARAESAVRSRTLFLANMSHELRTPMNGVLGLTELLLASNPREDQRETLGLMQRSGEHLLGLINDVIDFARLDADRMPLRREPVDLRKLAADTVALLKPALGSRDLTVTTTIEPSVPAWVAGDARRLQQVVTNLMGNAVKFTERGRVELVIRAGDALTLSVRDTGPGISPEVRARLFQPFEQAEAEANRRYGGSGLGLALSRRLVEAMGGTLTLDSTPGQGSTFTVRLPFEAMEAPAPSEGGAAALPGGARTVLVVDDNAVNLRVAVALLGKVGVHAVEARGGVEALSALEREPFDAVLMDCHMPGMDGFEVTRRIRALASERARTPIIALTASALPEELERCLAAGMDACITKPVTLAALRNILARVLSPRPA